jgi:hypothetical protein
MNGRLIGAAGVLAIAGAMAGVNAAEWKTPRTPWGEPDLQGTWSSEADLTTPFERPAEYGTRQWMTDQEFADRQTRTLAQLDVDNSEFDVDTADTRNAGAVGSATSPPPHWLERRKTSRRTSLVIDPPDGRVPATTPAAARRIAATPRGSNGNGPLNGPEDFATWDRCITRGMPSAIFPTVYNANTRIMQGPGYAAITYEMIHDTRVVATSQRPHVGSAVQQYFGDSQGRWDGDTLVIDVRNFTKKTNYRGSSDALHLTERFRRVDAGTLRYEVTFDDPQTWAAPWTAALDMIPQTSGMFEYACHEGNYALLNMLRGARAADQQTLPGR